MALGDEVYEKEKNNEIKRNIRKNVLEDLLKEIETKNSWGKNELKIKILEIIVKNI